jgi:hypothetical protein
MGSPETEGASADNSFERTRPEMKSVSRWRARSKRSPRRPGRAPVVQRWERARGQHGRARERLPGPLERKRSLAAARAPRVRGGHGNPEQRLHPGEEHRNVQKSRDRPAENGREQETLFPRAAEFEEAGEEQPGKEMRESERGDRFQEHR